MVNCEVNAAVKTKSRWWYKAWLYQIASGLKEIKQFLNNFLNSYISYTQQGNGSVISYRAIITRFEHTCSLCGACVPHSTRWWCLILKLILNTKKYVATYTILDRLIKNFLKFLQFKHYWKIVNV